MQSKQFAVKYDVRSSMHGMPLLSLCKKLYTPRKKDVFVNLITNRKSPVFPNHLQVSVLHITDGKLLP